MMTFFDGMLQKDRDEFKRVCNKLMGCCFLCKKEESTRADYYFVLRYKEKFGEYLEVMGYFLEINEEYGVIQLVNRQNFNHFNLKLQESIILLILRILYDEKKRELSLTEVLVNVGDIQEKYLSLKIREKQIDKIVMNNALRIFRRFHIIEALDKDLTKEDARIIIYDSILMAVRVEDIKQVFDKISIYRKGREIDETINEAETDQLAQI